MTTRRIAFTVHEVAAMTGYAPITVRTWISRGHIRRDRDGKIDGEQLITYLIKRGLRGQHAHRRARLDALLNDLQL